MIAAKMSINSRVASRRASAALDIFEPCLGKKAFRSAAKRLRRLRRACRWGA